MMKKKKIAGFLAAAASAVLLLSCSEETPVDETMMKSDTITLKVKGTAVYTHEPLRGQLGFNPSAREFRAGRDNMTDYFVLTLSALPERLSQHLTGHLVWTGSQGLQTRSGVSFEVEKIQDGTVWLWSSSDNIGAVVRILE